jgi:hypothetical protein
MSDPCDYKRCVKACGVLQGEKFEVCMKKCFDKYFECLHEDIENFANANSISPGVLLNAVVDAFDTHFRQKAASCAK